MTAGKAESLGTGQRGKRKEVDLDQRLVYAEGWPIVQIVPETSLCCGGAKCSTAKIAVVARKDGRTRVLGVADPREEHQEKALLAADRMCPGWEIKLEEAWKHCQRLPSNA
jgi:hypothetical protein